LRAIRTLSRKEIRSIEPNFFLRAAYHNQKEVSQIP